MKPIKLKIKGLNSFQEEQTIDFLKLTDRGLFGIFGPTGSGKSTILDGITLALYGAVSRKSSNFINTNCDRVNVSFEFQISGGEIKKYSIDREFKRKKDGNINSGKCKLVDITEENNKEVIADSVKMLNRKVEEIIGLNIDDFTRTVVLPQGKFSEFLKLEGKERREMLERLFNLEKYGDNLSVKLSAKIRKENTENSILEGQLKGYEDISLEKLKENEEELKNRENEFKRLGLEFEDIQKQDKKNEELWNMQNELKVYEEKENALKQKEEFIEKAKNTIELSENAEKVIPYITVYEKTIKSYEENKLLLTDIIGKLNNVGKSREKAEEKWLAAKKDKEENLSELIIRRQKTKDAIQAQNILKTIIEKHKSALKKKDEYKKDFDESNKRLINLNQYTKEENEYIIGLEKKQNELQIDEEFKERIQNGLILEEKISKADKISKQYEEKYRSINKLIDDTIKEGINLKSNIEKTDGELNDKKEKLENLIEKCPGDQNFLLEHRKFIEECSRKYEIFNRISKDIERFSEERTILEENINKYEEELSKYENELKVLKENQKLALRESMSIELRKELKEGEKCPVCGSIHHDFNHFTDSKFHFDLEKIEKEIKEKEDLLKKINDKNIKAKTTLETDIKNIEEGKENIDKLGVEFRKKSLKDLETEFEKLKISVNEYNKNKEELEKGIKDILIKREKQDGDIKALRAALRSYQNQKQILEKEFQESENEKNDFVKEIESLKKDISVGNFKEKNIEIRKKENERNEILRDINKSRKQLELLEEERKQRDEEIKKISEEIVKKETEISSYEQSIQEKIEFIKSKCGENENLEELLKKIEINIRNIEDNYENSEKEKDDLDKIFKQYNERLISAQSTDKTLSDKKINEEKNMNFMILSEGFKSIEEVKASMLEKAELIKLKNEVEEYKENISKIQGAINTLKNKIDGRFITKEEYDELKIIMNSKNDKLKECEENVINLKNEIIRLNTKLKEQRELLQKKSDLEHKLGMLKDLEKLFKGKKFVEFVAAHQLKYISIEASKRLKEISHGNYGIEVDENGKFMIRDYKNGGAQRDASTLSGGETFLASLSLALALSAQIQLKGTAPLELFFLDEGFGTLDDELLEVVMNSLERIHNDKLKVGIISHVESIKNRVPVKLIVSPAECGKGGSKVKIERS